MNILPKKRWHVRTKENIARVRRDEANAADIEKQKQERIKLAESEARTQFLRNQAQERTTNAEHFNNLDVPSKSTPSKLHVNLFEDIEDGTANLKQKNKEHEKEKKEEQEAYEKKIGYLTYLGQDTNEALGKRNWYDVLPKHKIAKQSEEEVNIKSKKLYDPLNTINKLLNIKSDSKQSYTLPLDKQSATSSTQISTTSTQIRKRKRSESPQENIKTKKCKKKSHKHKKAKKRDRKSAKNYSSKSSEHLKQKLDMLRQERLKREKEERKKAELLVAKIHGFEVNQRGSNPPQQFTQKYNSQFNPALAKQNCLN